MTAKEHPLHEIEIACDAFDQILQSDPPLVDNYIHALQNYQELFPFKRLTSSVKQTSSFFHRQWIRASIRGHLHELEAALDHFAHKNFDLHTHSLHLSHLWLGQARKLTEMIAFFKMFATNDVAQYLIEPEQLHKGDVILSYKTKRYLKRSILSQFVKYASNSSITHALIACHNSSEEPLLLASNDETKGLGIITPHPKQGEILLVFELANNTDQKEKITSSIDKWRSCAEGRTQNESDLFHFPEIKCQTASAIGVYTVILGYLGRPCSLPNPTKTSPGVFCSELIDNIFKEAGLLLSPRSQHDAVIGPVEIFYSPLLTLKGVIAHQEDLLYVAEEINTQFRFD